MSTTRRASWIAAAVCASVLGVLFQFYGNPVRGYINTSSLFYWWGFQWVNPDSEGEHGWLVLAISVGLMIWRVRRAECGMRMAEPAEIPDTGNQKPERIWAAVAAMVAGLALHALGFVAQQTRISIIGFLVCAWGVLRLGGGRRWGEAAIFPLGFLVFAIPMNVLDSVGFWLRMAVIHASAALAHGLRIGVLESGTQLLAPDGRYNYDVAAACSGIRSLTALTALSLLAGYLSFRTWRRRATVVLLCFPLVYVGNVARILSIIVAAQVGGQRWGDRLHEWMGVGVFVIVLGGVLAGIRAIEHGWPEAGGRQSEPAGGREDESTGAVGGGSPGTVKAHVLRDTSAGASSGSAMLLAGMVAGLAVGEMLFLHHIERAAPRGMTGVVLAPDGINPADLPAFIGTEWVGRRAEVSTVERETLPPDTGYSRKTYVSLADARKTVFVSIVLSGRDRTSIHRPELCLVGQGWTITGQLEHRFRVRRASASNAPTGAEWRASASDAPTGAERRASASDAPTGAKWRASARDASTNDDAVPATVLRVRREVPTPRGPVVVPQLVAYWFVCGDRVVATHWERFAVDAWNRVFHARADRWAYVLVQTDAVDGEAAALQRMETVLEGTLPAVEKVFATGRGQR